MKRFRHKNKKGFKIYNGDKGHGKFSGIGTRCWIYSLCMMFKPRHKQPVQPIKSNLKRLRWQ